VRLIAAGVTIRPRKDLVHDTCMWPAINLSEIEVTPFQAYSLATIDPYQSLTMLHKLVDNNKTPSIATILWMI
jgi:hypothetical protein